MQAHDASKATSNPLDEAIDWDEILQLGAADAELLDLSTLESKPQADAAWLLENLLHDTAATAAADGTLGSASATPAVSAAAPLPDFDTSAARAQPLQDARQQHAAPAADRSDVLGGPASGRGLKPTRRDKNIQAQRLWRVKQKERAEQAAQQVAALEQEMHTMQLAQGELARRNQALEQVLGTRGQMVAAAAEAAAAGIEPFAATTPGEYVSSGAESTAGAALVDGAPHIRQRSNGGDAGGGGADHDAAAAAQPPPTADGSRLGRPGAGSWQDDLAAQLGIGDVMSFTVRRAAALTLTWRQVVGLEAAAFDQLWHDYVNAMAACLLQLRAAGAAQASAGATTQRLAQLTLEAQQLQASMLLHDPRGFGGQPPGAAAAAAAAEVAQIDTWWQLLETARLGREQQHALLQHREAHLHSKARLAQTRNRFKAALPAAYSNEAALGLNARGTLSIAHERLQAALTGLQGTLNAERASVVKTTAAMWAVLAPAQYAHLAVGCPAPVDMLRLAEMLAVATGHAVLAEQPPDDDPAVELKPTWQETIRALEARKQQGRGGHS